MVFLSVMPHLEDKMGKQFGRFEVVGYTSQVVAGTIYQVKVRVEDGPYGYIHAKIFKPLPYTQKEPELQASQSGQTEDSPFDWSPNAPKPVAKEAAQPQADAEMNDLSQPEEKKEEQPAAGGGTDGDAEEEKKDETA